MPARGPAGDEQPPGIEAELLRVIDQIGEGKIDLRDDLGQPGFGRERIADAHHVDPVHPRSFRDEGKAVLVVALPVAAMDEHDQRRVDRARREIVEALTRATAIGNVELVRWGRGAHRGALLASARHQLGAVRHGRAAVVARIERGLVHAAINRCSGRGPLGSVRHATPPNVLRLSPRIHRAGAASRCGYRRRQMPGLARSKHRAVRGDWDRGGAGGRPQLARDLAAGGPGAALQHVRHREAVAEAEHLPHCRQQPVHQCHGQRAPLDDQLGGDLMLDVWIDRIARCDQAEIDEKAAIAIFR